MTKSKLLLKVASIFTVTVLMIALTLSTYPFSYGSVSAVNVASPSALISAIQNNQAITLTADIDLAGDTSFTTRDYSATFNGNGHLIKGLSKCLFATVSGTVKNVGVVGVTTDPALLAKKVTGTVQNCFAYGTITHSGGAAVIGGAVVEISNNGKVLNSFSCVDIKITSATMDTYVGGFIGKISGGTVTSCYSTGRIDATNGYVAGFANQSAGTVSDTYTTCQLKNATPFSKPSGVNGYYDNQLGLAREASDAPGMSTKDLMKNSQLSTAFAVTSTTYPALHVFYGSQWTREAKEIVKVSISAMAFEDVDAALRKEPDNFAARADYLTLNTYVDRTNVSGIKWSVDSSKCKIYDTVPTDNVGTDMKDYSAGTGEDLLRARFEFAAAVTGVTAKVTSTFGYTKSWYLNVNTKNPYFRDGDGKSSSTPFTIQTIEQLGNVRYYTLMQNSIQFKQYSDITQKASDVFYPIKDFTGVYNGYNKQLISFKPSTVGANHLGIFDNTKYPAQITNVILKNAMVGTNENSLTTGALIGSAEDTTVKVVELRGNSSTVISNGIAGGLIGEATYCTLSQLLVSVDLTGNSAAGALVGSMKGGTITSSGSTGIVQGVQNLGGLVGKSVAVDSGKKALDIKHSYSTAAVISTYTTTSSSAYVGGLVGDKTVGTIANSYAASYVYAPVTNGVGPVVGSGSVSSTVYYDSDIYCGPSSTVGAKKTTEQIIALGLSTTYWTITTDYYPQIKSFVNKTNFTDLSLLSTAPVYFQKYWNDAQAKNMTTGWIRKTFGASNAYSYQQPVVVSAYSDGSSQGYTVDKTVGWGFEATGGSKRVVWKTASDTTSDIGIRIFGTLRDDLQKVTYDVKGVSGVNTYVEIMYSTDNKTTWQGSQMKSVSGGTEQVIYDIPDGAYIKVRVGCVDDYQVQSLTIDGKSISVSNGSYISASAFTDKADIKIVVTLKTVTPPWGLRKETY